MNSEKQIAYTTNYIYYNPIKHKIVTNLKDYQYSSFLSRFESDEHGVRQRYKKFNPKNLSEYDEIDYF